MAVLVVFGQKRCVSVCGEEGVCWVDGGELGVGRGSWMSGECCGGVWRARGSCGGLEEEGKLLVLRRRESGSLWLGACEVSGSDHWKGCGDVGFGLGLALEWSWACRRWKWLCAGLAISGCAGRGSYLQSERRTVAWGNRRAER